MHWDPEYYTQYEDVSGGLSLELLYWTKEQGRSSGASRGQHAAEAVTVEAFKLHHQLA
jgi:hypothetical protein